MSMVVTITGMRLALSACAIVGIIGAALMTFDRGVPDPFGWGRHPSGQSFLGLALTVLAIVVAGAIWLGSKI